MALGGTRRPASADQRSPWSPLRQGQCWRAAAARWRTAAIVVPDQSRASLKCGQLAKNAKSDQTEVEFILHPSEVKVSHASMLKARRQHQKTKKLLEVAAKQAKRLAKQALAGPAVKKEKVKKEKVKKEKVKTERVKKVKLTKEELGRQDAKKSTAGTAKKGAS
jgi:hypothetical protein